MSRTRKSILPSARRFFGQQALDQFSKREWCSKVDIRFLVLTELYRSSLGFRSRDGGNASYSAAEKSLLANALRSQVNLALTKLVIAAHDAGEIRLSAAHQLLSAMQQIAHFGRQLTPKLACDHGNGDEEGAEIRRLKFQIQQHTERLNVLVRKQITKRKSGFFVANLRLMLEIIGICLMGTRLPAVLSSLAEPVVFRWFCWVKYQTSPEELLSKERSDNIRAYERLAAVQKQFFKWKHGLLSANDWKFKTDEVHTTLLAIGIFYGLASLSQDELTDCFDDVCPCGKEHTVDNLARNLRRVREKLRRSPGLWAPIS